MIPLVVPEPLPWVRPLLETLPGSARVIDVSRSRGWPIIRAARRLWVRGRTDRAMRASFAARSITDAVVARLLPRGTRTVIAPSLAAEGIFSVARERGVRTVLVEDLPDLATLHSDLDDAAAQHPHTPWLIRFRASEAWIRRQQREVALADELLVRSQFARQLRVRQGHASASIRFVPAPSRIAGVPRKGRLALFAGLAAARNGIFEAVEATRRAGLTLVVRTGEGSEQALIQGYPHVREATVVERERLAGVGVVLAPAWCESHAPEVELAAALGVPVIATDRGAGRVAAFDKVERGDVPAITDALGRALYQADSLVGPLETMAC